jgi:hypothetical protein
VGGQPVGVEGLPLLVDEVLEVAVPAVDIHALVIALALARSPAGLTDTVGAGAPTAEHDRRRKSLAAAVQSAFVVA